MILFDILSDILFFKRGDVLKNVDNENEVSPYMLNRWMSMHSSDSAKVINTIHNRYWRVFQNKHDWYRLSLSILPRNRFKKIEYIKKSSKEKTVKKDDNTKIYEMIAHNLELSVREVKSYIEDNNIDISNFKKILKNDKRSV